MNTGLHPETPREAVSYWSQFADQPHPDSTPAVNLQKLIRQKPWLTRTLKRNADYVLRFWDETRVLRIHGVDEVFVAPESLARLVEALRLDVQRAIAGASPRLH